MNKEILFVMVGLNIRDLRQRKLMTQETLAERAGLSRTSIINMENANQRIGVKQLAKILMALDATWSDVLPKLRPQLLLSSKSAMWKRVIEEAYDEMLQQVADGEIDNGM